MLSTKLASRQLFDCTLCFVVIYCVLQGNPLEELSDVRKLSHSVQSWLTLHKAKSFYTAINAKTLRLGVQSMLQVVHIDNLLIISIYCLALSWSLFISLHYVYII